MCYFGFMQVRKRTRRDPNDMNAGGESESDSALEDSGTESESDSEPEHTEDRAARKGKAIFWPPALMSAVIFMERNKKPFLGAQTKRLLWKTPHTTKLVHNKTLAPK
jgi:hypothetical protein